MIYSNDSPFIGAMIDSDREYGLEDSDVLDDEFYVSLMEELWEGERDECV